MGQKMNPNGLRVGIIKDWSSKWYADSKHFGDYLVEDHKIREYVKKKLYVSGISKVEIERTAKFVKVNVYTEVFIPKAPIFIVFCMHCFIALLKDTRFSNCVAMFSATN